MISSKSTTVRLRHPLFRTTLFLHRVPKYLRFVYTDTATCARKWDALDQLDDEPNDGEHLLAAILANRSAMHVSYTEKGRRRGEWWKTADYELVSPQPDEATMRDRDRWRDWCQQQVKEPA